MAIQSLTESSSSEADEPNLTTGNAEASDEVNSLTSVSSDCSSSSDSESSGSSSGGSCSQDQAATDVTLINVSQKANLNDTTEDNPTISTGRHDSETSSANQESEGGISGGYPSSLALASAVDSITSEVGRIQRRTFAVLEKFISYILRYPPCIKFDWYLICRAWRRSESSPLGEMVASLCRLKSTFRQGPNLA